jgi:uncharacterized protein (TIGR02231 family)
MRYFPTFIIFLALQIPFTIYASVQPDYVNSTIDQVTVYRSGATITRSATLDIQKGLHELIIHGISGSIDHNSISVSLEESVELLSVKHQKDLSPVPDIEEIPFGFELKTIEEKMAQLRIIKESLDERLKLLKANLKIKGANQSLTVVQMNEYADYYTEQTVQIKRKKRKLTISLDSLKKEGQRLQELRNLSGYQPNKNKVSIILEIEAMRSGTSNIIISYFVNNASWTTYYDVKMKDLESSLSMSYKGNVINSTGNNWEDVSLTLSTGNPRRSITPPQMNSWWLNIIEHDLIAKQKKYEMQEIARASNIRGQRRAEDNYYTDGIRNDASIVSENITALEFKVSKQRSIPSDRKAHSVELKTYELKADYQYYAVPKMSSYAYLKAYIPEWRNYQLSEGQVNVFIENSFQGKSYINPALIADTMELSLGIDIGISIKRDRLKNFTEKKGIGKKRKHFSSWELKINNNKTQEIDIIILDQFPQSTREDIKVELESANSAIVNAKTGELRWNVNIPAGSKSTKTFSYSVEYPKDLILPSL